MATNNHAIGFLAAQLNTPQVIECGVQGTLRKVTQFTWMGWIKVDPINTSPSSNVWTEMWTSGSSSGVRFAASPLKDRIVFTFNPKNAGLGTKYTYKITWDDRWHHVAFSASISESSSKYMIFVDGTMVLEGTLVVPAETTETPDTDGTCTIGSWGKTAIAGSTYGTKATWIGKVDEIIILETALNQSTIVEYINSKDRYPFVIDDEDDPVLAYFAFDDYATSTTNTRNIITDTACPIKVNNVASSSLWTTDRPFLGNGANDTSAPTAPTAPTTSLITSDGFTASWGASTDNIYVQFYELQIAPFNDFTAYDQVDTGLARTHTVTNLLPNTTYYWRTRSFDAALNASTYTAVQSVTTSVVGDIVPPNAPTNLQNPFVSHLSFTVSFTASTSTDTIGYKLDVATDINFTNFVLGYKGKDIGNVTTTDVYGVDPLSSYYVRIRAYDNFDNESAHSSTRRVNTPAEPDDIAPTPVASYNVHSITARTARIDWEASTDNVGVIGYYLDVATDDTFIDYALTTTRHWEAVDVGNKNEFLIDNLAPNTSYFARARAYDGAGNISDHSEVIAVFQTLPASIYEGGLIDQTILVNEVEQVGITEPQYIDFMNESGIATFKFDLGTVVGSVSSLSFLFQPRQGVEPTVYGTIDIQVNGTWLSISVLSLEEELEIDLTSLINSDDNLLDIVMRRGTFRGYIDAGSGVEGSEIYTPRVFLQTDPLTSTQPVDMLVSMYDEDIYNHLQNPSFDNNTTNEWSTVNGLVATVTTAQAVTSSHALQIVGNGGILRSENSAGGSIPHQASRVLHVSFDARCAVTGGSITLKVYKLVGGVASVHHIVTFAPFTQWTRMATVVPTTTADTYYIEVVVNDTKTYFVDNFFAGWSRSIMPESGFTGVSRKALWTGTANDSDSRSLTPSVQVVSTYVGDANGNNSTHFFVAHENDEDDKWIRMYASIQTERDLKQFTMQLPHSVGCYNMIPNPSFEIDTYGWSGGERVNERATEGEYSYFSQSEIISPVAMNPRTSYDSGLYVRADVYADPELVIKVYLRKFTDSVTYTDTEIGEVYGDGTSWKLFEYTQATRLAEHAYQIVFRPEVESEIGGFFVDKVMIAPLSYAVPYKDGDSPSARWEGTPHKSTSAFIIQEGDTYKFRVMYYDPEGFFDITSDIYTYQQATFDVPQAPDDVLDILDMQLTATSDSIDMTVFYAGDDNNNSSARVEFRRMDQTSWSEVRALYDRPAKRIGAYIPNLKTGAGYMVRLIASDPDGTFGAESGIITDTITTTFPKEAADAEPFISFNGFVLMGRTDRKVGVTQHNAFGFPARRLIIEDLSRTDGAVELQHLWGRRQIEMEGFISGDSRADLEDTRRSLKRSLAAPSQRLIIDSLAKSGRYYFATCENLDIEEDGRENIVHLKWRAKFSCADPFAYDATESSLTPLPITGSDQVSLVNDGDVNAQPEFEIKSTYGYATSIVLENLVTGEKLSPKATFVRGDRLLIDTERRSVMKNGTEVDYMGSFIELVPRGNTIKVQLSAKTGSPTATFQARWRNRFL